MVVPDLNLLVYAHVRSSPWHAIARRWWEELVNSDRPVGLALLVRLGFVRLLTNPKLLEKPLEPVRALAITRLWLTLPNVQEIAPTARHDQLLAGLLESSRVTGRSINDAHLATLCLERQAELHTNDPDFKRFPGIKVVNPLEP